MEFSTSCLGDGEVRGGGGGVGGYSVEFSTSCLRDGEVRGNVIYITNNSEKPFDGTDY